VWVGYVQHCVKESILTRAAVLVVVTVVAMVSLPPLIDCHDLVFGNWLSKRLVPRTPVFKVQALEEGMAEPVDQAEGDANPQNAAEAKEYWRVSG
jgi:hypothetical protein